ncbi:MAG: hypothetical protein H0W25_05310 [Acidimicrobiia bacterium]|nr:hypothetical protein [Acidimicrobiia bacterium]
MLGPILIVLVVVVILPITLLVGGALAAALFSWALDKTSAQDHEGNELLDLNK